MNYFINFVNSSEHLPYVVSSYLIVFFLLFLIFIFSFKKTKDLEKNFQDLNEK